VLPTAIRVVKRGPSDIEAALNDPAFLERTAALSFVDLQPGARSTFGFAPNTVLGATDCEFTANARNGTAQGTTAFSVDVLRAVPFIHSHNLAVKQIAMNVTTGAATSVARIGIYDAIDDLAGNLYPNRLLFGSSQIDCSSTAYKFVTVNVSLKEGRLYWLVQHFGTATCTSATVPLALSDTLLGNSAGVCNTHMTVARAYAALPDGFPSGATMAFTVAPALQYLYGNASVAADPQTYGAWFPRATYMLRAIRLVKTSDQVTAGSGVSRVVVRAQLADPLVGRTTLGLFDSAVTPFRADVPVTLYESDRLVRKGQGVVASVEHFGQPHVRMADVTMLVDYAYVGDR